HDGLRLPGARDRRHAAPNAKIRAEAAMRLEEKVRHDGRYGAAHRPGDLDDRHHGAEAGRGRGDLEPDEAGADDNDLAPRAEPLADPGRVGDSPQGKDARKFLARRPESPPPRSGRQDEMPVADRLSLARLEALRRAVDPGRADAEPEI